MKKIFLSFVLFSCIGSTMYAQSIQSYQTKTKKNASERSEILHKIRTELKKEYQQDFQFVVRTLNVYNNHAWFRGDVSRKDGKPVVTSEYDDCCHVESLLKKEHGKWKTVEAVAFSTDVWWENIWDKNKLPKSMFLD